MVALRLRLADTLLLICDVQERFRPLIHKSNTVIQKTCLLNNALNILDAPCLITEQYPKALGNTVTEIIKHDNTKLFEKYQFSMITDEVKSELSITNKKQAILCGIEAHVCVLQTSFDLLDLGYEVFLAADAVSSQRSHDRTVALNRMKENGVVIATTESIIFELMRSAKHDKFKEISNLIKNHNSEHINEFAESTNL